MTDHRMRTTLPAPVDQDRSPNFRADEVSLAAAGKDAE